MTIDFFDDNIIEDIDCCAKRGEYKLRDWLIEARKTRGKTQAAFAAELGIAQSTLAAYETGDKRPSVKTAKKIGLAIGLPWVRFFDGEGGDLDAP